MTPDLIPWILLFVASVVAGCLYRMLLSARESKKKAWENRDYWLSKAQEYQNDKTDAYKKRIQIYQILDDAIEKVKAL